jgi:signal peptidase I
VSSSKSKRDSSKKNKSAPETSGKEKQPRDSAPLSRKQLRFNAKYLSQKGRSLIKKYRHTVPEHTCLKIEGILDQIDQDYKNKVYVQEEIEGLNDLLLKHFGLFIKSPLRESIESFSFAIGLAIFLRFFCFEAFTIPSGSMIPTLAVGDFIFINKLAYGLWNPLDGHSNTRWSKPEQGDVIVFSYPCEPKDYIKRVVAVGGDTVEVRNGYVHINGKWVNEVHQGPLTNYADYETKAGASGIEQITTHYKTQVRFKRSEDEVRFTTLHHYQNHGEYVSSHPPFDWTHRSPQSGEHNKGSSQLPNYLCYTDPNGQSSGMQILEPYPFPWIVPDDHVFVMGDNRDHSSDSRYWGFVPIERIKGRASFIWLSINYHDSSSFSDWNIRWERLFTWMHQLTDLDDLIDTPQDPSKP